MTTERLGVLGKFGRIMLNLFLKKYDVSVPNESTWIRTWMIGWLYDMVMIGLQTRLNSLMMIWTNIFPTSILFH